MKIAKKTAMQKAREAAEYGLSYYREMTEKPMRDVELGNEFKNGGFTAENCDVQFFPLGENSILVQWSVQHVGFGQLYLNLDENGRLVKMDSETMQKPFIKALLAAAVDKAELND